MHENLENEFNSYRVSETIGEIKLCCLTVIARIVRSKSDFDQKLYESSNSNRNQNLKYSFESM